MIEMKLKVLQNGRSNPQESRVLIIAEDLIQPEGFAIAEECYPGIWVHSGHDDVQVEMIPVSHPFLAEATNASSIDISAIYTYVGGREGAETMISDLIEKLHSKG